MCPYFCFYKEFQQSYKAFYAVLITSFAVQSLAFTLEIYDEKASIFSSSPLVLTLRTNGAEAQHTSCGALTPMVRKPKHVLIISHNKRYIPLEKGYTVKEKYSLHDKDDSSLPYRKRACTRYNPLASPFILMFCLQILLTSTSSRSSYPLYLLLAPRSQS